MVFWTPQVLGLGAPRPAGYLWDVVLYFGRRKGFRGLKSAPLGRSLAIRGVRNASVFSEGGGGAEASRGLKPALRRASGLGGGPGARPTGDDLRGSGERRFYLLKVRMVRTKVRKAGFIPLISQKTTAGRNLSFTVGRLLGWYAEAGAGPPDCHRGLVRVTWG